MCTSDFNVLLQFIVFLMGIHSFAHARDALSDLSLDRMYDSPQKKEALLVRAESALKKAQSHADCSLLEGTSKVRTDISADWLVYAQIEVDLYNLKIRKDYAKATAAVQKSVVCDPNNLAAFRLLRELRGE